jgi:hypothetical protein
MAVSAALAHEHRPCRSDVIVVYNVLAAVNAKHRSNPVPRCIVTDQLRRYPAARPEIPELANP